MRKKFTSKLPMIIAVILVSFLGIELLGIRLWNMKIERDLFYVSEEMNRSQTMECLENPLDLVYYIIKSCENADMDRFMRGTAISEMTDGMNLEMMLCNNSDYIKNGFAVPSGKWEAYAPFTRALLADQSATMYESIMNVFNQTEKIEVLRVDYVDPVVQISEKSDNNRREICSEWGADGEVDVVALIKYNEQLYQLCFQVFCYDNSWKLMINQNEIVQLTTQEQYDQLVNFNQDNVNWFESRYWISPEKGIDTETMLPLNYYIVNGRWNKSKTALVDSFFKNIERSDFCQALSEFDLEGDNVEERIHKQSLASEQLQEFMVRSMDSRYYQDKTMLTTVNNSPNSIVSALNPEELTHFICRGYIFENMEEATEQRCVARTYFNQRDKNVEIVLKEHDGSWFIESLKANID